MKNAAMYNINSAGVEQSKAAYAQVTGLYSGNRTEHPRSGKFSINSSWRSSPPYPSAVTIEKQILPSEFSVGIPIQLLSNRPDVKAAEMSLASAYYNTNSARSAFYPQITLSGSAGWTNSAGSAIINPGKFLAYCHRLTDTAICSTAEQNIARLKAG